MFTFVNLTRNTCNKVTKREALNAKRHKPTYAPPSGYQFQTLQAIRNYLLANQGKRRNNIYAHLSKVYRVEVSDKRMRTKGGVGSYMWMPRRRVYRVQVGASRIDTRKPCFRYAPCIEICDFPTKL